MQTLNTPSTLPPLSPESSAGRPAAVVVQKFGGTSVADAEKLRASARHAKEARERGQPVMVVVSAMGDGTDDLLALAATLGPNAADKRELDQMLATGEQVAISMMAMTLRSMGVPSASVTVRRRGSAPTACTGVRASRASKERRSRRCWRRGRCRWSRGSRGSPTAGT
ncbi:MAG: hypothetical protein QM783_09235 [Phycisphaerales bacterium]